VPVTAERDLSTGSDEAVYLHLAGAEAAAEARGDVHVLGEHCGRQTVVGAVRDVRRFVFGVERHDDLHRAEHLGLSDDHGRRDVADDCRRDEPAALEVAPRRRRR